MPGQITIDAMTKWENDIHLSLNEVLSVSMDTMERTGQEACMHAIILMAQSARKMTPIAPEYRKRGHDEHGEYVERWQNGQMKKLYKWMYSESYLTAQAISKGRGGPQGIRQYIQRRGTWEGAQTIYNRGMARRSWMWGFGEEHPMKHVTVVDRIESGGKSIGYQLTNRLGYISKIMPPGYEVEVEQKAMNKIMGQARARLERIWPPVAEAAGARMAV